jgi:predicted small metal-binding protein
MARKYIDCREFPSESNCSITIMADNADELVQAAVQHAVAVHKHEDTRNCAIRSGGHSKTASHPNGLVGATEWGPA